MERKFSAYAPDGTEHRYKTALDAQQACDLAGYTLHRPGTNPAAAPQQRTNYGQLSSEAIVRLCVQRNVRGYMTMNRDQQIKALQERDAQDASIVNSARNPQPETQPETQPEPAATEATDKLPEKPKAAKKKAKQDAEQDAESAPEAFTTVE